jgi:integral membrane protein (TIGR01906 family)
VSASPVVRIIEVALFTISLLVVGLVLLALLWSGEGPYRDLARANDVTRFVFVVPPDGRLETDVETAVAMHGAWARYVTGATDDRAPSRPPVTNEETTHMRDVRHVFDVAKFLVPVALFVIVIRLQRARLRGAREMWRLVRDGALIAAGLVALIGAVAAVAFEPLFLAFHYVFFPQGNFLFDPATSNIVRLYPDWYWEGITLRVGLSFIAVALALSAMSVLRLARAK